MKKVGLLVLGLTVLLACSESSESVDGDAQVDQNTEQADAQGEVQANTLLSMEVTGMTCEMGCGGTITDKLIETGAVARVEFDFEEDRATNIALISYDDSKISDDDIETLISELNDGQFTVGSSSTEPIENATSSVETTSNNDVVVVETSSSFIELPNMLDILSSLFSF